MTRIAVEHGDALEILPRLAAEGVLFDSCVTDPPYHLTSIVKRFGGENAKPTKANDAYKRAAAGFMGQQWDGGDIAFRPETWRLVFDVLKPGAHLVAFGAPRSYHRMACAIEDAGFEIRDSLMWIFGTGFPKSHNVGKAIDKAAGAERAVLSTRALTGKARVLKGGNYDGDYSGQALTLEYSETAPATEAAARWEGWGTALKPAFEPIVLARKPLIGTIAANVLAHGTGALNIDACRIGCSGGTTRDERPQHYAESGWRTGHGIQALNSGRWPANIVHDGSPEVVGMFPSEKPGDGVARAFSRKMDYTGIAGNVGGSFNQKAVQRESMVSRNDGGSAARFFYSAKADAADRLESKHPTVKPVDLMRWLVRLITPPGGRVLDPFAGSGTTGMACMAEGFDATLIEREARFVADIKRRIAHVSGEDGALFATAAPSDTPPHSRTKDRADRIEVVTP